jgi:hypothetical protein
MIRSALFIALLQLIAILIGIGWNSLFASTYPTITHLPVSIAASCLLGSLFFPSFGNRLSQAQNNSVFRSVLKLSIYAALIATLMGSVFGLVTAFFRPSAGRVLFLFSSTLIHSLISLLVVNCISPKTIDSLLRTKMAKIAFSILFGVFVCAFMVSLLELTFFTLGKSNSANPGKTQPNKEYFGTYLQPDAFFRHDRDLGVALHPTRSVTSGLRYGEKLLWETSYSTDSHGRRTTVNKPQTDASNIDPRPFAIFFGCSYLFGEGSLDSETIPSRFAAYSPKFETYNYGVPGYGTQHMLAIIENSEFQHEFAGRAGLGFYLYLEDIHEARVIGDMDIVTSFGANFPCYLQDGENQVERHGTFTTGLPIRQALFQVLAASQTRKYFGLNFPKRKEADYRLTASIIATARDKFEKSFPGSKFIVIRYPHRNPHKTINRYLIENNISQMDFSDIFDPVEDQYQFVGDGHPTPRANDELASKIANELLTNSIPDFNSTIPSKK